MTNARAVRTRGAFVVADDDAAVRKVLTALLEQEGYVVRAAGSGEEALRLLEAEPADVVITDIRMPGIDGVRLLEHVTEQWPDLPVILLTAHGTVPLAVQAMKAGAEEFMMKPFDRDELLYVAEKALAKARRIDRLSPEHAGGPRGMMGTSTAMEAVHSLVRRVAPTTSTVLVRGESGTGKELVAKAIHDMSRRKGGPLVKIHCGALPEALLESELFGYEKGAFTGAAARKPGRVELADQGTLFLDEIGDLSPTLQVKLLRLLQEREFERLGGTETLRVDVRFVAATHRDLEDMVQKGSFREDLFYRLNVVPVWLPPLRARRDDIGTLAVHFCATFAKRNNRPGLAFDAAALEVLAREDWPGNVRQLQNLVERLVVVSDEPLITAATVERELRYRPPTLDARPSPAVPSSAQTLDEHRRQAERDALVAALRQSANNRTVAARLLGVSRRTLYHKLEEHNLL